VPWTSVCCNNSEGSVIGTGGFNRHAQPTARHPLRSAGADAETLAQVPINDRKKLDGTPLRLGDVGDVVWDTWPLFGDAVITRGPRPMLIVEKLPWANTLDVTRGWKPRVDAMRPGLPGIDIDTTIFRPATFIRCRSTTSPGPCSSARSWWWSCSFSSCGSGGSR